VESYYGINPRIPEIMGYRGRARYRGSSPCPGGFSMISSPIPSTSC
jgi:hypothetical protein